MGERPRRWVLIGLIGLAFVLRVAGLGFQSLWRDEVDAIRFAGKPLDDLFHAFVEPGQNGPLYYLLLRPWLSVAGESEFALRFFSVVSGVLAVPLVYQLARRLFPRRFSPALIAAVLAATSPYLVWYSQEGKMYALVVVLALLSMDCYLAALEQGGWFHWLAYVAVTSAAFYVHLLAALMVPVQVLAFFLHGGQTRRIGWKPWLASLAALTVPYLPLLAWQVPQLLRPAGTGFRFVPLHEMIFSLLANYSLGVVQGVAWWIVVPSVILLLAAGLFWKEGNRRIAPLVILAVWLMVPIVGLFLVTLSRPLYTARYLVFVLPAYLLLLAVGVVGVARRSRLLAGFLLVSLLASNGGGLWIQASTPLKADFRAATRYLVERLAPGDLIVFQIPYGRYSFDYYVRRQPVSPTVGGDFRFFLPWVAGEDRPPYRWVEGLYTNAGMEPGVVDRQMANVTMGGRVVWLVATEAAMWDERGLVQGWLDEHATLSAEAQFVRVAVYRYELR